MPPFISFRVLDSRSPFMNDIFAISGKKQLCDLGCQSIHAKELSCSIEGTEFCTNKTSSNDVVVVVPATFLLQISLGNSGQRFCVYPVVAAWNM
jgi:hypothetical protein